MPGSSSASVRRVCFLFLNDAATTEIYTLSLHDALPISGEATQHTRATDRTVKKFRVGCAGNPPQLTRRQQEIERSEEHTSELQSRQYLVCRLLLEKKKPTTKRPARQIYQTSCSASLPHA